jgi:hypothetical protein
MIRKSIIVILTLAAAGACIAWALKPTDLSLVPMQKTEAGRKESHWVLFLHDRGLTIEYGPYTWLTRPSQYFASYAGWGYAHHRTATQEYRAVLIPYWALLLLFIAYPAFAFVRGPLRRWRRHRRGLCINCAYDLTGNVSGTCPECGAEVKQR